MVRRLWDSWEDDAIIRDAATGRYIDRNKLHYVDFRGKYFSVKGPSITPRPPQGQPVVAALAHAPRIYEFAAASADLVFITPTDDATLDTILDEVKAAGGQHLKVYADVVVTFGGDTEFGSDALIFDGSPADVVDLLLGWQRRGIDGARLRPAVNATDLPVIVDEVVPLLQRANVFRTGYADGETLRAATRSADRAQSICGGEAMTKSRCRSWTCRRSVTAATPRRRCATRSISPNAQSSGVSAVLDRRTPLRRRRQFGAGGIDRPDCGRYQDNSGRGGRRPAEPHHGRGGGRELRHARCFLSRPDRPWSRPRATA